MLKCITPAILKEVIRLQRDAHEADLRENAGRPIWRDFGTFQEPTPLSPERSAYRDFMFALPMDVLRELQALYWLGLPRMTRASLRTRLKHWLAYSWSNDDHIPECLYGKNIHLAEALERSQELLDW